MKYFRIVFAMVAVIVAAGIVRGTTWRDVKDAQDPPFSRTDVAVTLPPTDVPTGISDKAPEANAAPQAVVDPDVDRSDVRILFGGDMMFDRYIRETGEKRGYDFIFAKMHDRLMTYDSVVANLEGPITTQPSVSIGSRSGEPKNYVFTFDPSVSETLRNNNIRTVNLGNNHILNFGESGLVETRQFLDRSNVDFFGDPKDDAHRMIAEEIKGMKIAFVNYNQFVDGGDETQVLADIRSAKQTADIVVAYTHWGTEYVAPPEKVKALAHAMIDAGADAIIGSHPHIVQESETYRGKKIYYSLGNFVFDQFFQDETRMGLAVEMTIHRQDKSLSFEDRRVILSTSGQVSFEK